MQHVDVVLYIIYDCFFLSLSLFRCLRWWFQMFFIFSPKIGVSWSNFDLRIFFKWLGEKPPTSNQMGPHFCLIPSFLSLLPGRNKRILKVGSNRAVFRIHLQFSLIGKFHGPRSTEIWSTECLGFQVAIFAFPLCWVLLPLLPHRYYKSFVWVVAVHH